jgi:hypothetical protein
MVRTSKFRQEAVLLSRCLAIVATTLIHANIGYAQSIDTSEDAALVAAERALLEGLSSKGSSAFEAPTAPDSSPRPPELKPATYQQPILKEEQLRDDAPVQVEKSAAALTQGKSTRPSINEKVLIPAAPSQAAPSPNMALKGELEASHKRIAELERQLEEVRGQLTMAETELSRLATISEARNRASLGRSALPVAPPQRVPAPAPVVAKARPEVPAIEPTPASSADLVIATVDVEKAELRLGPGKNHSALMTVAKGSRLAVEARQGEWLRVFAPNGQRAWVNTKLVTFGSKGSTGSASSAVRVHGYSSSIEDEAFKRVQSLTAGR